MACSSDSSLSVRENDDEESRSDNDEEDAEEGGRTWDGGGGRGWSSTTMSSSPASPSPPPPASMASAASLPPRLCIQSRVILSLTSAHSIFVSYWFKFSIQAEKLLSPLSNVKKQNSLHYTSMESDLLHYLKGYADLCQSPEEDPIMVNVHWSPSGNSRQKGHLGHQG